MDGSDLPVEYDMSFSTNARINYLLWLANEAMSKDEPLEWFKACKNMLKECSITMKEKDGINKEMELHKQKVKEIEEAMNNYNTYQINYRQSTKFSPPREVFDKLYDWEIMLRKKLDKMGLLLKRGEDKGSVMV